MRLEKEAAARQNADLQALQEEMRRESERRKALEAELARLKRERETASQQKPSVQAASRKVSTPVSQPEAKQKDAEKPTPSKPPVLAPAPHTL